MPMPILTWHFRSITHGPTQLLSDDCTTCISHDDTYPQALTNLFCSQCAVSQVDGFCTRATATRSNWSLIDLSSIISLATAQYLTIPVRRLLGAVIRTHCTGLRCSTTFRVHHTLPQPRSQVESVQREQATFPQENTLSSYFSRCMRLR